MFLTLLNLSDSESIINLSFIRLFIASFIESLYHFFFYLICTPNKWICLLLRRKIEAGLVWKFSSTLAQWPTERFPFASISRRIKTLLDCWIHVSFYVFFSSENSLSRGAFLVDFGLNENFIFYSTVSSRDKIFKLHI